MEAVPAVTPPQPITFVEPEAKLDEDEYLVTSTAGTRRLKVDQDLSGFDMYLMSLSNLTGELHWPLERYVVRAEPWIMHDPTKPAPTQEPFVRSMTLQVLKREGASLSAWMKLWSRMFCVLLTLGLLSFVAMSWSWIPGHALLGRLFTMAGVLTPMYLAVAFSLGMLVQKLGSYGWRRCLRQLWALVTVNAYWKRFRADDRLSGDYEGTSRDRSSVRSNRDSGTFIR